LKLDNYQLTKWTFLACGALVLLFGFGWGILRWRALHSWPSITATVTKSNLEISQDAEDGTLYTNAVIFSYQVNGQSYQATSKEWGTSTDEQGNRTIAATYAVGTTHPVLYNPANPSQILVEAGFTIGFFKVTLFCLLLGGIFFGIGVLLLFLKRGR